MSKLVLKSKRNKTQQSAELSRQKVLPKKIVVDLIAESNSENATNNAVKKPRKKIRNIFDDNIIRPRDLPQFLSISRTTCWRLEKDPSSGFPKKIRLSKGAVGYFRHELVEYLEKQQKCGGEMI